MSTLRWNPLLGEWVIITRRRADRPFQEPEGECPFCHENQETKGEWDVLTVNNKYPALDSTVGAIPLDEKIVMEAPAHGHCKIIILSPNHGDKIEFMGNNQLEKVLQEYLRIFKELDGEIGIEYIMEFENRGKSIGVSLDHPHAQVYALPFIPPRIKQELLQFKNTWEIDEECLACQIIENELKSLENRVIHETENFVTFVPFFARLPYEVHIYPRDHVPSLIELEDRLLELGQVIRDIVKRYAKIFDELAYTMAFHTRPSVGEFPYWHFHIELYPPWRSKSQLKYMGGIETSAGVYRNDSCPEDIALKLREAI
jgi:UDPglucose--hexose-1-phosphate uridylyltransferase